MTRASLVLALVLLSAGCSLAFPLRRAPVPGSEEGDWAQLRDGASRRATLYDALIHRANASATWLSPQVREAGIRRRAGWEARNQAEIEQAVAKGRADAALGEEFVLAFFTAERRANDLDSTRTVWHLELDDGETRTPATEITALPVDATLRQLYTYVDPFDLVYRVRFKWTGAPLAGRPFKVRIAGALGELVLDFGPGGERTRLPQLAP